MRRLIRQVDLGDDIILTLHCDWLLFRPSSICLCLEPGSSKQRGGPNIKVKVNIIYYQKKMVTLVMVTFFFFTLFGQQGSNSKWFTNVNSSNISIAVHTTAVSLQLGAGIDRHFACGTVEKLFFGALGLLSLHHLLLTSC